MKVLEKSLMELKIQHHPIYKSYGVIMILVGSLSLLITTLSTFTSAHLSCNRTFSREVNCSIIRRTPLFLSAPVLISDINKAFIFEHQPKGKPVQEVMLSTSQGEFSLLAHSSVNYKNNRETLDRINAFLDNPIELYLNIQYEGQDYFVPTQRMVLIGIIAAGLLLAFTPVTTWTFNKYNDTLTAKRRIVGFSQLSSYSLKNILAVQVQRTPSHYLRNGKQHENYRIVLLLNNNSVVPLTVDYSFFNEQDAIVFSSIISDFLFYQASS